MQSEKSDSPAETKSSFSSLVDAAVSGLRMHSAYHFLARLVPKSLFEGFRKKLLHAGITEDAADWAGSTLLLAIETGIIAFLFFWIILRYAEIEILSAAAISAFAIVLAVAYAFLFLQIEDRKNRVERALPEMLRIIASNLRAGMTPSQALRQAARPDFGPLEDEIKYATAKSLGTESFTDALNEMSQKFESEIFARTVALFSASLRSGGNLALLLENTADDIRSSHELKLELETSTRMYLLFILFVTVVGTPLLFSVSIQFTQTVENLVTQQAAQFPQTTELGPQPLVKIPFSTDFLYFAALATLLISSVLAAGLMGVIQEGKIISGAKYAPFIAAASLSAFYLVREYAIKIFFQT